MKKTNLRILSMAVAASFLAIPAIAQNNVGVEFYKSNQKGIAKQIFLDEIAQGSKDPNVFYYLGDILFNESKLDSAGIFFDQGLALDPESGLNKVGKAKLLMKNAPEAAQPLIKDILSKKNKKNIGLHLAVAKAYFDSGSKEYEKYISLAKEINLKTPEIYLLEGDILLAAQKYGEAAAKYEQAIHFDNECKEAYLKYAQIYAVQNKQLAIDMLNKLLALDANSALALRELGEIYYNDGKFGKAAEVYQKYMQLEHNNTRDLTRYALILYFSKAYKQSMEVIEPLLAKEPNNPGLNRIALYNAFNLKDTDKAMEYAQKLLAIPDVALLADDYAFYGRLLASKKEATKALEQFEKAYALDSTKTDIQKDLADAYSAAKRYDEAIAMHKAYLSKVKDEANVPDFFALGQAYLGAASAITDSIQKREYLLAADPLFAKVIELNPDSHLGYQMRAAVQSGLDDEAQSQGLAKPYYEKMLEILLTKNENGRYNRPITSVYSYLAYYYLQRDDSAKAKEYSEKILAIDPNNALAKQIIEGLNQK